MESSSVHCLVDVAIKEAYLKTIDGVENCVDVLRYLKTLNLPVKRLSHAKVISPLNDLLDHENVTIREEAKLLFTSWIKCFYPSGTDDCKKEILKPTDVPTVCSVSKKRKQSQDIAVVTQKRSRTCGTFAAKPIQKKKESVPKKQQSVKVSESPKYCSALKKNAVDMNTKQSSLGKKQQHVEVFETPKCSPAMKNNATEMNTKQEPVKVSQKPPALEKNTTEMLELFEVAKKSADMASAKGLLLSKEETLICVETLDLLLDFPISSTAPDTRRIIEKLGYLTRHKDRKICHAASALLHRWRQNMTGA